MQDLVIASGNAGKVCEFAALLAALPLQVRPQPSGLEVEGQCVGEILPAARGAGGFGYDPVFLVPELGLSFAELDRETKGRVSHRGRAFAQLEPGLRDLLAAYD